LAEAGIDPVTANGLALFGLSAFEGAITLSRTLRSTGPLAASAEIVAGVVASALGELGEVGGAQT
jgi:hypothetical protein